MTEKNTMPPDIWEALRRLLNCNRSQLAERLGVNRRTLNRWENQQKAGEPIEGNGLQRSRALLRTILATIPEAEDLQRID